MESLLGWFSEFVHYMASWAPRPSLIDATEAAVLFTRGKPGHKVGPGLVWWVPAFQKLEQYSALQDAYEFRPCVLTTKDGVSVALGFALIWSIEDILLACTTCDSFAEIVREMGESILPEIVVGHTWDELLAALANSDEHKGWSLNRQLKSASVGMLKPYGLRVHQCRINNIAKCRVVRVIQNGAHGKDAA